MLDPLPPFRITIRRATAEDLDAINAIYNREILEGYRAVDG
jgi:L-amino acid N-acyltransferase YncA